MMLKWNWRKSRIIFPRENEHLVYLFIWANHIMGTNTPKPPKLEIWTDYKSIHDLASLQFWMRYVTWYGAYAP